MWALFVILIVLAGIGTYSYTHHNNTPPPFDKTSTGHDVNLQPPTAEDKKETDEHKQEVAKDQNQPPAPAPTTADNRIAVVPFVTFAGQEGGDANVSGYVSEVFEDGGTCTATFTKDSLTVVQQSQGFKDYRNTNCAPIVAPRAKFTQAGTWTVVLSYDSPTAHGSSQSRTLTIE
jgi:hypothetical protein